MRNQVSKPNVTQRRKIAINALHITWGVNAGTETYFTNIVKPWYEKDNCSIEFFLLCHQAPPWWEGEKDHFRIIIYAVARSFIARLLLEQIFLPMSMYRSMNAVFCPGYVGSLYSSTPQVITVHDGFAWVYPEEIGRLRSLYWKIFIPGSIRKASKIIAVSQSTAEDIVRFCGIDGNNIKVIHEAGSHLCTLVPDKGVLKDLQLNSGDYYLCVGIFKGIKNPWRILAAYSLYRQRKHEGVRKLVLVGSSTTNSSRRICESVRGQPGVVIAGRVDDGELAALYGNSAGLVFMSLWEGFGIPILEAQSLGCPVVTSAASSMPEVVGEGGIIEDPLNVDAIAHAMLRLENSDLVKKIVALGYENVRRFDWARVSDETLGVLKEV